MHLPSGSPNIIRLPAPRPLRAIVARAMRCRELRGLSGVEDARSGFANAQGGEERVPHLFIWWRAAEALGQGGRRRSRCYRTRREFGDARLVVGDEDRPVLEQRSALPELRAADELASTD